MDEMPNTGAELVNLTGHEEAVTPADAKAPTDTDRIVAALEGLQASYDNSAKAQEELGRQVVAWAVAAFLMGMVAALASLLQMVRIPASGPGLVGGLIGVLLMGGFFYLLVQVVLRVTAHISKNGWQSLFAQTDEAPRQRQA